MKALEHLVKELKFYLVGTSKVCGCMCVYIHLCVHGYVCVHTGMCVCKFVWVCVDDSLDVGAANEKILSRRYLRMFEGKIRGTRRE